MTYVGLCVRCGLEPPLPGQLVCELCCTDESFYDDGPDDLDDELEDAFYDEEDEDELD